MLVEVQHCIPEVALLSLANYLGACLSEVCALPAQATELRAPGTPAPKLAGSEWFAEYTRGAGHSLYIARAGPGLKDCAWMDAVKAVYAQKHLVIIGK